MTETPEGYQTGTIYNPLQARESYLSNDKLWHLIPILGTIPLLTDPPL
ncbi:MAG: hypothetical protein HQL72_04775 [Magnetococcales bacterium]|nr:hypothetical protein [Magnetococcales bacterium]